VYFRTGAGLRSVVELLLVTWGGCPLIPGPVQRILLMFPPWDCIMDTPWCRGATATVYVSPPEILHIFDRYDRPMGGGGVQFKA
jgi:hypothetical protein